MIVLQPALSSKTGLWHFDLFHRDMVQVYSIILAENRKEPRGGTNKLSAIKQDTETDKELLDLVIFDCKVFRWQEHICIITHNSFNQGSILFGSIRRGTNLKVSQFEPLLQELTLEEVQNTSNRAPFERNLLPIEIYYQPSP